jgi:3-isopropylmalate/(R)-2-methylmalate dehydratase small subunit
MRGNALVFGDEINTDLITPSDYFGESFEVMAEHVFEPIRPDFHDDLEPGDIVVAGSHFGSGSSRESAAAALQVAGVGAVVAESFSRIFYRNSIAWGLPAVAAPGVTDIVAEGDQIEVHLEDGVVRNCDTDRSVSCDTIPAEIRAIFDAGGLRAHYEEHPEGLRLD